MLTCFETLIDQMSVLSLCLSLSHTQMIFDPTMTKKKKKKKKPFMLEEDGTEQPTEEIPVTECKETIIAENLEEKVLEADDEDSKKKGISIPLIQYFKIIF